MVKAGGAMSFTVPGTILAGNRARPGRRTRRISAREPGAAGARVASARAVPDHETRPDESTLVRRARGGDRDAYAALVRRHQAVALRVAALAGPTADVEDAVQEAFVKAHRALGRYDERRPFRPWLLAIVANEARSRGRSAQRAAALTDRAATLAAAEGGGASAEESALRRIGAGPLAAAVATLRPDEQELLVCRFVLDLSEEETAAALGVRRGTVKSRASRALARLRAILEEEPA